MVTDGLRWKGQCENLKGEKVKHLCDPEEIDQITSDQSSGAKSSIANFISIKAKQMK